MNNIERSFRDKAIVAGRMNKPGFYLPNGATAPMDTNQMRAQQAVGNGRAGATNPIRLGVGEIMPERAGRPATPDFTLRGSVPAGQALVPTDGFDPSMRGKTSPLPEPAPRVPGLGERAMGAYKSAVASPSMGDLAGKGLTGLKDVIASKPVQLAGSGARKLAKGVPVLAGAVDAAGLADVVTDDRMTGADVATQASRLAGRWGAAGAGTSLGAKGGALAGALTGPAAPVAVPVLSTLGALGGGIAGYVGADKLMDAGAGETAPDMRSFGAVRRTLAMKNPNATAADAAVSTVKDNSEVIGPNDPRYAQLMNTPHGGIVGQDELPSAKVAATTFKTNPFTRAATPEAELARQSANAQQFDAPINAALAERAKANGGSSFRDAAAQALFNAKQELNGSGIKVTNENGTPTFSGDNRAGGGQLYRAADGSVTSDWSKTQAYADAIQRNAKDQERLTELTRGAALSGDREAVARLTAGDQRLAGIAKEAETEKSLRDAVKGGSRNAALVLAEMEKAKAAGGLRQQELNIRQQELQGAREDRALNRQLREDGLRARIAENLRAAEKDERDNRQTQEQRQREVLKDVSVGPDGKLDPELYKLNRGRAANVKDDPNLTFDQNLANKESYAGLVTNLDNKQMWLDKLFASPAGTDPEKWYVNDGLRGGFVTDSGKHISNAELRSLSTDQQRMFRELLLDQKSIPKKYRDQLKGE